MARKKSLRSQLYRGARDLGNVEAATHGYSKGGVSGAAVGEGKRVVRRAALRTTAKPVNKLLRKWLG